LGSPIPVGKSAQDAALEGIAVNTTTNRLYVVNGLDSTVTIIDGSTNTVLGSPIPVGHIPREVGVNPTTNRLYVANYLDDTVSVIDSSTSTTP
jgi:YVTN family beta-propeller protein